MLATGRIGARRRCCYEFRAKSSQEMHSLTAEGLAGALRRGRAVRSWPMPTRIPRRRAAGLGGWRAYAASTASGAGRSGRRATAIRSIPHPWATAENRIRMV